MTALDAILSRSAPAPGGCRIWRGARSANGYAQVRWRGRVTTVGRVVLRLLGHRMAGRDAAHHCDDPGCVEPSHLFAASRAENVRDAIRKGRLRRDRRGRWRGRR